MNKIFIIGFNKTATTALHHLFEKSNIKSIHWDFGYLAKRMLFNLENNLKIFDSYDTVYTVFSDMTFRQNQIRFEGNFLFKIMDKDYPNSLFIYNFRNEDDWIESRLNARGMINGKTLIESEMIRLNTLNPIDVISNWRAQRKELELLIDDYFINEKKKQLLKIDIKDPKIVQKISRFIGINLKKTNWQAHNVTKNKRSI